MKRYLLIDDIRTPNMVIPGIIDNKAGPSFSLEVARTYEQGYELLEDSLIFGNPYELVLLDHDLGSKEELDNGYMLVKRILDRCHDQKGNLIQELFENMPRSLECVSDNGPGRANIISIFKTIESLRR